MALRITGLTASNSDQHPGQPSALRTALYRSSRSYLPARSSDNFNRSGQSWPAPPLADMREMSAVHSGELQVQFKPGPVPAAVGRSPGAGLQVRQADSEAEPCHMDTDDQAQRGPGTELQHQQHQQRHEQQRQQQWQHQQHQLIQQQQQQWRQQPADAPCWLPRTGAPQQLQGVWGEVKRMELSRSPQGHMNAEPTDSTAPAHVNNQGLSPLASSSKQHYWPVTAAADSEMASSGRSAVGVPLLGSSAHAPQQHWAALPALPYVQQVARSYGIGGDGTQACWPPPPGSACHSYAAPMAVRPGSLSAFAGPESNAVSDGAALVRITPGATHAIPCSSPAPCEVSPGAAASCANAAVAAPLPLAPAFSVPSPVGRSAVSQQQQQWYTGVPTPAAAAAATAAHADSAFRAQPSVGAVLSNFRPAIGSSGASFNSTDGCNGSGSGGGSDSDSDSCGSSSSSDADSSCGSGGGNSGSRAGLTVENAPSSHTQLSATCSLAQTAAAAAAAVRRRAALNLTAALKLAARNATALLGVAARNVAMLSLVEHLAAPPGQGQARHACADWRRSGDADVQQLRTLFHLPITEAALRLGMCVTVLKKRCRQHGIMRWPYRQICAHSKDMERLRVASMKPGLSEYEKSCYMARVQSVRSTLDSIFGGPACATATA
ncbi:hypothetical protein JKP88DRAFT_287418 [Tribonema minus]|uniref:RWP-RK domain-containing protein n=1 Tax=Tribonema minus TaxID=303371 RepID=A0A835Z7G7_9STRA|nr:hypothetical protein JKP88DRAFT_287418 [Tribonema minus]